MTAHIFPSLVGYRPGSCIHFTDVAMPCWSSLSPSTVQDIRLFFVFVEFLLYSPYKMIIKKLTIGIRIFMS